MHIKPKAKITTKWCVGAFPFSNIGRFVLQMFVQSRLCCYCFIIPTFYLFIGTHSVGVTTSRQRFFFIIIFFHQIYTTCFENDLLYNRFELYSYICVPPDVEIMVNLGLKGFNVPKIRCNEIVQHIMGLETILADKLMFGFV